MSLIVGQYYRGDPKQKPKQWGSVSAVRSNLRNGLADLGIIFSDIIFALPFWNPGDQYNYANLSSCDGSNIVFSNNRVSMTSGDLEFTSKSLYVLPEKFSVLVRLKNPPYGASSSSLLSGLSNDTYNGLKLHAYSTNLIYLGTFLYGYSGESTASIAIEYPNEAERDALKTYSWVFDGPAGTLKVLSNHTIVYEDTGITGSFRTDRTNSTKLSSYESTTEFDSILIFKDAINDLAINSLIDNPYQLWQQPTFRTYFDLADAPSTAIPKMFHHYNKNLMS